MTNHEMHDPIVQFVCFETSLPRHEFLARWQPFAASFLARGIERVVLGEGDGAAGYGFVSRNLWPAPRFHAVFGGRVPGDAGGGPVVAVQAGAFRIVASAGMRLDDARADVVKTLVLVRGRDDAEGTIVSTLGEVATQHARDLGWATYASDPTTRGGRFNVALEVYGDLEATERVRTAVDACLSESSLVEDARHQTLREVLALP